MFKMQRQLQTKKLSLGSVNKLFTAQTVHARTTISCRAWQV